MVVTSKLRDCKTGRVVSDEESQARGLQWCGGLIELEMLHRISLETLVVNSGNPLLKHMFGCVCRILKTRFPELSFEGLEE